MTFKCQAHFFGSAAMQNSSLRRMEQVLHGHELPKCTAVRLEKVGFGAGHAAEPSFKEVLFWAMVSVQQPMCSVLWCQTKSLFEHEV